jgi:hypothetical protein
MTDRFDPNIPPAGPTDPSIQGQLDIVAITEQPTLGSANLVVNRGKSFEIEVRWRVFGNLVPLWLTALGATTKDWVVTAFAESQGPGPEISLGEIKVPVDSQPLDQDVTYSAKLTVAANTLPEGDPGNVNVSGVYKIVVTTFLDSRLGPVGYDMMGYAEGPIIKVENPL